MWDITARLLCVSEGIFLWGVIMALCCTALVFNVWTHPSLHAFVYMSGKEQSRLCHFKNRENVVTSFGLDAFRKQTKVCFRNITFCRKSALCSDIWSSIYVKVNRFRRETHTRKRLALFQQRFLCTEDFSARGKQESSTINMHRGGSPSSPTHILGKLQTNEEKKDCLQSGKRREAEADCLSVLIPLFIFLDWSECGNVAQTEQIQIKNKNELAALLLEAGRGQRGMKAVQVEAHTSGNETSLPPSLSAAAHATSIHKPKGRGGWR